MAMGDIIKRLRLEHHMTQEELGAHIGVQKSAIRKYECGRVENIPRASIEKMASIFGVKPSYLMGFDEGETEKAPSAVELSADERMLIEAFRALSPEDRALYLALLQRGLGR